MLSLLLFVANELAGYIERIKMALRRARRRQNRTDMGNSVNYTKNEKAADLAALFAPHTRCAEVTLCFRIFLFICEPCVTEKKKLESELKLAV